MRIDEESSFQVLSAIDKHANQLDLAKSVGFSVGKVNYIVKALVEKGFVKMNNFSASESKRNYVYLLTPEGIRQKIALTEAFIARKKAEYEQLQQQLEEAKSQQLKADEELSAASHKKQLAGKTV